MVFKQPILIKFNSQNRCSTDVKQQSCYTCSTTENLQRKEREEGNKRSVKTSNKSMSAADEVRNMDGIIYGSGMSPGEF